MRRLNDETGNRELMRVFRDIDLVEQLGSGMRRMLGAYTPDIFRYTETFFHVDFRFPEKSFSATLPPKGGLKPKGGPMAKGGPKTRVPSSATMEFRIQIFEFFAAHPDTTTREIATHFCCARSAILKHFAHLRTAGVARFVGPARGGHWEVIRPESSSAEHTDTSVADLSAGGINGGSRGGINGGINEALLSTINKEPGHGVAFYLKAFPVGRRTLERAMATLIAAGKIEHRGSKKTGGYFALVKN